MRFLKSTTIFIFLLFAWTKAHAAGMETQMDRILQEMSAYTEPGSYETQRRSSYFGGRYTMKSRIFNENLVTMTLPSARGGCNGIDVYGGSFSFVSSDKISELLRAVASNAKGYAFQLAMDNMCADCIKWMNDLQTKVQKLNEHLSNSCQLAQGIVDGGLAAARQKEWSGFAETSVAQGIKRDFSDAWKHVETGPSAFMAVFENAPEEANEKTGAITYKAMREHSLQNWISGGDDPLLEQIMSMTGSIVITGLRDAPGLENRYGAGGATTQPVTEQAPQIAILPGGQIRLEDLMYGKVGALVYNCDADATTDNCRIDSSMPNYKHSVDIIGFEGRLIEIFNGSNGIIDLMRSSRGLAAPTDQQRAVLSKMPGSMGSKLFTIAPKSPEAAKDFVNRFGGRFALEVIRNLVDESFKAVETAMSTENSPYSDQQRNLFKESRDAFDKEYQALTASKAYPKLDEIEVQYNALMQSLGEVKLSAGEQRGGVN